MYIDLEQVFLVLYRTITLGLAGAEPSVLLYSLWSKISFVGAVLTPILLILVAYTVIRSKQVMAAEMEAYAAKAAPPHAAEAKNERWEKVQTLASSDRPADWRLAILEADVMLDETLISKGYGGESLGERLKGVERGDLRTLDDAWEAHKIRNQLAHTGSDYILTQREARRAIDLFGNAFRELDII